MAKERERNRVLYQRLGASIRELRKELQMTQNDLGDRIGIARASVANIELGKQRVSLELLFSIGKALKREPKDLLPRESELHSPAPPIPEELVRGNPELKDWLERVTAGMTGRTNDTNEVPKKEARAKSSSRRARTRDDHRATGTD